MGIVRAVKSGNWSDPTTWNTGALPTSADDVYTNTFTVTIDQSFTVLSIQSGATTGVTAGGGWNNSAQNITMTCTGTGFVFNGSNYGTGFSVSSGNSLNFVGNMTGTSNPQFSGSGTYNITGTLSSGSLLSFANTSLTFNITGTLTSNSGGWLIDTNNTTTNIYNITGNCVSNGGVIFSRISNGVTIRITGSLTPFNNVPVINFTSTPTVTLTGPFYTSSNGTHAVAYPYWKWFNTGLTSTFYQVRTNDNSTIRTLYTADSVGGNPAVTNVRSGTVYGPASELTGTCAVPAAASVAFGVPVDNTTGTATLTAANVRAAVGLASANLDTQLAAIPTTAAPTAVAIRTELDTNSTKLANLDATVSSRSTYAGADTSGTTTLLNRLTSGRASALDNLDATISSRLADSSYQAPLDAAGTRSAIGLTSANLDNQLDALPTAVENAQAVRTELTTELNNLDAAVSTRSTFNPGTDTVANVTLVDTTTNLTNPPDVPTTTEIAEAVANELDPTLTTIDSNVLSRLAAADYTEPPTAEQNAGAVRTELTAELGNLDAAVSTRSTFNPATDTVANVTTVNTLTNSPDVPSESEIADAVRVELTPELERVANCATVETTGDQLAALNP